MDGFVFGDLIKAGEGGILRCSNGEWIVGFVRKLVNITSTVAEL